MRQNRIHPWWVGTTRAQPLAGNPVVQQTAGIMAGRYWSFLRSGTSLTIVGGGGYVAFTDHRRYPRMIKAFSEGNILPPFKENHHETAYFPRPGVEQRLRAILGPTFSNSYYTITSEVGGGKSRTIVEVVRELRRTDGHRKQGAPIYVSAQQGKSFPDCLAAAVNFHFDEHISFRYFLDCLLKIRPLPRRDEPHKLERVLDGIEESAFVYSKRFGRPAVIVVDGIDRLTRNMPEAVDKLLEKAKLWSDTNTVKMVFVSNSESVDRRMQKCPSCWSRAAAPIHIGDLSDADATSFLQRAKHLESIAGDADLTSCMADSYARETVRLVGGRIHQLIAVKGAWLTGATFEGTACELRQKEREKFLDVFRRPAVWKVVEALRTAPGKRVLLSRLIERTNTEDVELLLTNDIIRCVRDTCGLVVTFESKLTEHIVDEFYQR
ncbi:hypothetical protein LSAT2_009639 [Lamellibrachia satsuma]|nr:hypothetical protein LSAT2_009639 [Lamellibrachia satsuma]